VEPTEQEITALIERTLVAEEARRTAIRAADRAELEQVRQEMRAKREAERAARPKGKR
jgi:hypothetical protein